MWLRRALKLLLVTSIITACSPSDRQMVDKLNSLSYAYHYRSIDSTAHYAALAEQAADDCGYHDGLAEALNNKAFVSIVHMDYDGAEQTLDAIPGITDNQLELVVSYVQQMRLCQRRSRNRDFYDYRERAHNSILRIEEERDMLTDRQWRRLIYAETEFAIVNSTYYYYMGLEQQSIDALSDVDVDEVKQDTTQFLNYLYNIGAGGILTEGSDTDIYQQEVDYLLRCFQIASRDGYPYFTANSLEAIAEHLIATPADMPQEQSLALVNPDNMPAEQLAVALAEQSLLIFQDYGDIYQIAGAYRTLASCHRAFGNNAKALENLEQALADSTILQAPDLVASIREQLSVAYAAIDDKAASDYNRNRYLDLQEQTRQDRQLEARAGQLDRVVSQLNMILVAVVAAIVLLVFLLWLFRYLNRRQKTDSPLDELIEERNEQLAVSRLHLEEGKRRHLQQRAKMSLVNSLLPLIDRMVYTVNRQGDKEYVCELIDKINADNEVLTHWIQLHQGQLDLHIESFQLQPLFDIIARSRKSFQMKGLALDVKPTEAIVKADRILTLFMLNTLADNARKFTNEGGVTICAEEMPAYVEVSVADTGIGMDAEQLAHVFDHKLTTHGFGLLNCKGIIEKYRKLSQLFSVCSLQAESKPGQGSRFFFRLPKGRVVGIVAALVSLVSSAAMAQQSPTPLARAAVFADSAYFSNINATYERTLVFADSCIACLNRHYRSQLPHGEVFMLVEGDMSVVPPEIQWLHDSLQTNYNLILDIRNESAVAALALHQWQRYAYNNRIYTLLFKELSADNTLADYCRAMQQTKTNRTIAVVLLSLVLLAILPTYYFYYLRPRLNARFKAERMRRDDLELLEGEQRRVEMELANYHVSNSVLDNCLSALKHETMYYPSRIRQLIDQNDMESVGDVVGYYRELYNLLSQQAMSQVERVKLSLSQLDYGILGDQVLIDYLFNILKKEFSPAKLDIESRHLNEKYVEIDVHTHRQPSGVDLFNPSIENIPYLLCRQIVRDHGEATNRRACSIRTETRDNETIIIIILPAYGKVQSNHS